MKAGTATRRKWRADWKRVMRRFARTTASVALAFVAAWCLAGDGPYVVRSEHGRWQALFVDDGEQGVARQRVETLPDDGAEITVAAVGKVPAFRVKLRGPAPAARDDIEMDAKQPLLAVADTHGEFEILVAQLWRQGVIDEKLDWSFGRGHLVVLGDVFDRGPNQVEILWLLYKLEAQAAEAGGGSHLVLGNHELMVMSGDVRYLNPKYRDTPRVLGVPSYSTLFGSPTVLGQWLRSRPAMLRVNDSLFLHAGVSPVVVASGLTMAEINTQVRSLLAGERPRTDGERASAELLMGSYGPMWYRGYFPEHARGAVASDADVDAALKAFGVRRIVIGHTIVPTITALYGGRVLAVQVYPKRTDDGAIQFESLLMRDGRLWRATPEKGTDLFL